MSLEEARKSERSLSRVCWVPSRGAEVTETNITLFWAFDVGVGGKKDCQAPTVRSPLLSQVSPPESHDDLTPLSLTGLPCSSHTRSPPCSRNTIRMPLPVALPYFLVFILTALRRRFTLKSKAYSPSCAHSFLFSLLFFSLSRFFPFTLLLSLSLSLKHLCAFPLNFRPLLILSAGERVYLTGYNGGVRVHVSF